MTIYSFDPSDTLESKGQVLEFYQTFSGASVSFKAFLDDYSENFASQWSNQSVFGRPDPIQTFQNTKRSLSLKWRVPAFGLDDAQGNLIKTSTLARMLYPEYSKGDNAATISKGPLIKIKFANLIYDAARGPGGDVRTCGLLGVITSFTWSPVMVEGFFDPDDKLFPKALSLGIQFNVLHQHTLGWEKAEAVLLKEDSKKHGKDDKKGRDKGTKINDNRENAAANSAPSWGSDAALFPWSAAVQKANTNIGTNTVGDDPDDQHRKAAEDAVTKG